MNELKLVLKVMLFSALLLMFSQIYIGGETIESRSSRWLTESSTARYLQGVANGAIKASRTFLYSSKQTMSETLESFQNGKSESSTDREPSDRRSSY